jgi:glycosyltransferase involved in cell wall biosynthesis
MDSATQTAAATASRAEAVGAGPTLSIVVPAYNEFENIALLEDELAPIAKNLNAEVIIVDDGSTDGTAGISELRAPLRIVHTPHRGKGPAMLRGCRVARSEVIVTMDADLQEFPEQIALLLAGLSGADFVQGIRADRKDQLVGKRAPSRIFNLLVGVLFGRNFGDINCGFRAFRRDVLDGVDISGGRFRFLPLLAHLNGRRVALCPIEHRQRRKGDAKYNSASRYLQAIGDIIAIRLQYASGLHVRSESQARFSEEAANAEVAAD